MAILYDRNEETGWKWEAYCDNQPSIRGKGDNRAEALEDLTQQLRAIISAVLLAQGKLCDDNGSLAESG